MEQQQACQTPLEDIKRSALEDYEKAATVAHERNSFIPKAIKEYDPDAAKLRKALVVADKALEHYGDDSRWANPLYSLRCIEYLSNSGDGYDLAQQARTEIANILEGKE